MLIKKAADILSSEITEERVYLNRRDFMKAASAAVLLAQEPFKTTEPLTSEKDATTYNNYYEFGRRKEEPAKNVGKFVTKPWSVSVEGMVKKPATYALEDLLKGLKAEDRVYRFRCVEGWSMVLPWSGVPLAQIVKKLEPLPSAKFIEFTTVVRPNEMTDLNVNDHLQWPYVEGLRMDEANNPLSLLATGLYGKPLLGQNGAPVRLVTPWKYGFKNVKSIVKIRLTDQMPATTWALKRANEYGFYANVNPEVDHPRWSQAKERRIGVDLAKSRKTLMFNGYTDQVASMYSGMDLRKFF
jgi:sulfoxide reductase catalytic subunit YedY